MGATTSKFDKDKKISLNSFVNAIATKYILSQNFKNLKDLNTPSKCDNLVILTSEIISKYLDNKEIIYLAQHLEKGKIIDKKVKDNVIFFNNKTISKLDEKNSIKKKRMCIGIAKFYIKINMLFSAIVAANKSN